MPVPQIDGVETGYNHLYTSVSYQTTAIAQNTVQPASSFSEGMAPMSMPTVEIPSFTAEERQQILAMPEPYMYYSAAEDVKPLIVIAQEAAQATEIGPPTGITANEMVISAVSAAAKAAADNPSAQARMIRVESDDEDELAADGSNVKDTYSARAIPSRSMSLPIPSPEVLGVVFVDVVAAKDLPPLKNFLHTGFDMDPFAIVTFGRNTFRTQAIRHTLNPIWNERLYFHLAKHELSYPITFTIMDKDKFSNNDRVATASLSIMDLLSGSNVNIDDYTGRNDANNVIPNDMDTPQEHTLTMLPAKDSGWEGHCTITFRVRFIRYTTLRRRFWHSLTEQYDSDGNQRINRVELLTMLDSLGSTLTEATIDGFFRRFNKDPAQGDELEFDELAMCLEQHLQTQHGPRPVEIGSPSSDVTSSSNSNEGLTVAAEPTGRKRIFSFNKEFKEEVAESGEQVIRIRECPICHKPDLLGKDDVSILTHVAICTLNDPEKVDRFMMGNFVTEAQAQRRWFNKLAAFVSYGSYSIGKNNANIIVLDRATGQLIEEKMPTYIRMGIRMLYQSIGSKTTVESKSIRNLFASLSIKQGKKFTNPESVRDIAPFIEFHQLNVNEIADPLDSFANFNEFFYRKLKPGARHIAGRNDPRVAVSPADARILCFPTVTQATQLWIKGDLFTLPRLLDDAELAARYEGGALCIFRLAPQDYHRFHIPVDGVFSEPKPIDGAYYTVNPMAIRSSLDVYGENKRIVSVLESEKFGRVTYVCIGAMLVGSIVKYIHGDEHGYFAFGGSTIVMLFEPNRIQLDADLLENASKPLETLVSYIDYTFIYTFINTL
ncbi:phosphatidylserine decarboxylase-domain-containing protein [Syncephalis plumigaleata]|nr:phosphatidylserine decarboxylase-domain-containing protein [Syncephalis plumigaleata]